jgi:hypothetical protein
VVPVSDSDLRARADLRFQEALERAGARDPREFYRERLRELRGRDDDAYQRAVAHYETRLIPAVAAPDSDPLAEWLDYGRLLAQLTSPGRTVVIDETGRASDFQPPVPPDRLVLHLPASARDTVLPVGLPRSLSAAQRATYALLVQGRRE